MGPGELWLTPSVEAKTLGVQANVSAEYAVGSKSTNDSSETLQNAK